MHHEGQIFKEHAFFIQQGYACAKKAASKGNQPFGAILVSKNQILLSGENTSITERDTTKHAEINLVSEATRLFDKDLLSNCIIYTSTEPCVMCRKAIYWSGISTLVFGCSLAGLEHIMGRGFTMSCKVFFSNARRRIDIIGPILEEEGLEIHRQYYVKK